MAFAEWIQLLNTLGALVMLLWTCRCLKRKLREIYRRGSSRKTVAAPEPLCYNFPE